MCFYFLQFPYVFDCSTLHVQRIFADFAVLIYWLYFEYGSQSIWIGLNTARKLFTNQKLQFWTFLLTDMLMWGTEMKSSYKRDATYDFLLKFYLNRFRAKMSEL